MFAKDFIADAAFVALVAWAMTDVLARIRTKREQRQAKALSFRAESWQHGISKSSTAYQKVSETYLNDPESTFCSRNLATNRIEHFRCAASLGRVFRATRIARRHVCPGPGSRWGLLLSPVKWPFMLAVTSPSRPFFFESRAVGSTFQNTAPPR